MFLISSNKSLENAQRDKLKGITIAPKYYVI